MIGLPPPDYELSPEELLDRLVEASARTKRLGQTREVFYWRGIVLSRLRDLMPPFGLGVQVRAKHPTQSFRITGAMNNFVRAKAGDTLEVDVLLYHPDIGWLFETKKWMEYGWTPFLCADFEPVEQPVQA